MIHLLEEDLQLFADGRLGGEDLFRLDAHLAVCRECRDRALEETDPMEGYIDRVEDWISGIEQRPMPFQENLERLQSARATLQSSMSIAPSRRLILLRARMILAESWLYQAIGSSTEARAMAKDAKRIFASVGDELQIARADIAESWISKDQAVGERRNEGVYTAAMVRELFDRMRMTLESSPAAALRITGLAIDIANSLDVGAYPSGDVISLRAQAFRDHAYVLSFMGRYPEALEFADRSKRLFEQVPLSEYDLARLALVRASIFRCIDRTAEAVRLARDAAETFKRYGDTSRYMNARIAEAAYVTESGAVEEALEIWKSLESDQAIDSVGHVRALHNMALCYRQMQRFDVAAAYLKRSANEFDLLEMTTEATRSRSSLGQTLLAAGRPRDAAPVLRQTWREFERLDMVADAGLAALQLTEALLLIGDASEVAAICRDLIARFTAAGMTSRAITALSFLREAAAIGQATPSLVRRVYDSLRELPAEQARLFASPPESPGK